MNWLNRLSSSDEDGYFATQLTISTVEEDVMHPINIAKTTVLLTKSAGKLMAISAYCPHAAANLKDGHYSNGQISCPDHHWVFDVHTGQTVWPPDESCRLKRYPTKVIDGYIFVQIT